MRDGFDTGGFDECFDSSVDDVSGFDSFDTPEIDIETDFSDSSDILDDEFSGGVDEYLDNDIDVADISTESFDENLSSEELLVDENFDTDLEDNFDMEDISEEAFDESFDTEDISEEDFADSFTMDDISDSDLDIDDTSEEEFSESDEFEETITEDFDSGFYDGTSLDEVPEDMQPYFANEYSEQEVENLNEDPLENEIEEETTDDVYEEVLNDNDVSEDYSSENIMEDENSVEQENDFDYEENLDEEIQQLEQGDFQEEISQVYSEDEIAQADADELQNDDSFNVVSEAEDVVDSETIEVEKPTEELTPQQEMLNYYSEHNYGQMDYAEYSQDPEWQEINQRYIESLEHSEETSQGTPDEFQEEISQVYSEDEIAQADADELQNGPSYDIDSIESSSLSDDAVIENFDSEQGFNDTYEVPGSLNSFEDIDSDSFVREYDDFEQKVLSIAPDFYETGQFYEQGVNDLGYEGTCGPTSQANAINTLLGTNEMTENKVLHIAVDNNLCEVGEIRPADNGGTSTDQFMELYNKVNEQIGDKLDIECFEYDNSLSVEQMAEKLDEGAVLNIAVDSQTLWGENYHIPGTLGEDVYTDHWITVTGVNRNDVGDISSFNIIDSGGGVSEVSAETYDRMCFGESGRQMIDPTCIVVRKK